MLNAVVDNLIVLMKNSWKIYFPLLFIMQLQPFERLALTLLKYILIWLIIINNVGAMEMACDRSRQLFNYTWGIISHGPTGSNYTQDSHCEWLIKVPNKKYITLIFHFMGTECSYDYLFVYNGDTLNSPLLGSFSGKSNPQEITSDSGSMLILLYSDANYVLGGFQAEYFVSDCPRNCTNHGVCTDNKCKCNDDWKGLDCSFPVCPNDCGSNLGRGLCIQSKCKCSNGFSGQACDLYKKDSFGNSWHWLSSEENGPPKRAAHTAVYLKESDSLYIFGGYDLNKILGDFYTYDFNTSTWQNEFTNSVAVMEYNENHKSNVLFEEILGDSSETNWYAKANEYVENLILSKSNVKTKEHQLLSDEKFGFSRTLKRDTNRNLEYSEEQKLNDTPDSVDTKKDNKNEFPSPRYGHAACRYPGGFVIYGGKISKGNLSDELWFYNITSKKWSLRAKFSTLVPPKLTRHTITLVRKNLLYLFGGSTVDGEFSSKIYSIQLNSDEKQEQWEYVRSRGGKEFDVRLVAHVAVYYSKIDSLMVYGGIAAGLARLSKLSDKMFSFQISSRYWSEIHYPRNHLSDSFVPRERAFHSGVIVGSYLVIFGGYSHRHNKEEICYDNQMYLYHLGCHTWISRDVLGLDSERSKTIKPRGVFAHASDVRNGNTLLIHGGYHGNVNADFKAYVLPPTLASREGEPFEPDAICGRYRSLHECTSNPECGWCSADEICYGRTVGINCTTNLQTTRCPGLCPSLGDCHSCLIHGELSLHSNKAPFSVAQKLKLSQCTWCVQNARCHHKEDNFGVCGLRDDTPLQATSWWGSQGTEITSVEECRTKDRRPGLTFIKYKHPINRTQPDAVTIVNATTIDFEVPSRDSRLDASGGGSAVVTRFLGFLRIPNDWANGTENLKMCTSFSSAILRLGRNNVSSNLEVVSNVSTETTTCRTAHWASGSSVILRPGRYLVDFESKKSLNSGTSSFVPSKMVLMHNRSSESGKVFTFEYLEPYENGSCSSYSNCLLCLMDTRCGWCELNQKCLLREADETVFCSLGKENWSYLILQPSTCINCFNYISCESCVSSPSCEWWIDDARCSRRGTALVGSFSVQAVSECPTPCHLRSNCQQCLDERGRCVWCDATKECFSFSVYTSEYQFGLCREWVDQSYSGQNNLPVPYGFESSNITHGSDKCKNCSKNVNCSSCLKTLSCGWCYELENPINGLCVAGDFNSPKHDNCESYLGKVLNTSLGQNETGWSYASCPDVDECDLALDDCHPDATCKNTYGSYMCTCKRGFQGDGRLSCTKTCYNDCVHGTCSMAPDYRCECHLGWTGEDCGINCGCNNHSTCNKKVGVCDECQEWTTGEYCQYCKSGSYGNATSDENCRECECNGHGDAGLGFCDSHTGTCFCKDNTTGKKCEKCMNGFYGNPENGGICYFECNTRGVIADFGGQGLGSFRSHLMPWEARLGSASPKECLWVLKSTQFTNSTQRSLIQLTINGDINVKCQDNSVFVYEGFPDLVSLNSQNHALGTFCQREDKATLTVETKAGTLTVLYRRGNKSEGFNATYKVLSCPDNCPSNRVCIQNECLCRSGWTGPNCSVPICRNNCSSQVDQGFCYRDYGRCNCKPGFGGEDCSVKTTDHQIVFTELFNSIKISGSLDHLRKMIPRFGHSLVIDRRGSLWMFGGYSPSHGPLNDIRLFDTKNNTWVQVTVDSTRDVSMPQGRYFHASEIVNSRREIYVFGGIARERGDILRDFWKFSIKHQRWVDVQSLVSPPPVAGHTLTLMKDSESENLILIGGVSPRHGFLNKIWSYDMEIEQWTTLMTIGKGPFGIFGHTTVYHGPTLSFYVYGGFLLVGNRRIHSNRMYSFHHPSKTWSTLPTFEEYNPSVSNLPQPRFLHSAITTKDYMLVFGGKILRKSSRSHFSDLLIAYSYGCNQWIRLLYKGAPIVGSLPSLTFGQAMAHDEETGAVYVVGGFDNVIHSEVTRIDLPSDLCNLWEGKDKCRSFLGCSFCSVTRPDKTLKSYCYSSSKSLKESCDYYNGTLITNNGVVCDAKWFQQRSCEHFKSCEDCLAKWPIYVKEQPVCKWCGNCSRERCVSVNQTCKIEGACENVTMNDHCSKYSCLKSDYSGEFTNESCSGKKLGAVYLPTCSDFKNCTSCLSQQCKWSTVLRECISQDFQPLFCAGGICGSVLNQGDVDQCPEPCSAYDQCATCLKNSRCGWCSKSNGNYSGEGVCTEGSLDRTFAYEKNMCSTLLSQPNELVSWDYTSCPWENECANGHHTCNPVSEVCEDLPNGFRCVCGPGYKSLEFSCDPVCSQGCLHGKCVQPEKCLCDFGYVGTNCSFQCQCNGHSNCLGPDRLGECLECHNNTKGAQCEHCKPLFVGDPTNNGTCTPCFEYCNRHTNVCVNDSSKQLLLNKSISELISMLEEGPKTNALCIGCLNNTSGRKCGECIEGFFRGSEDLTRHCRPCECHGHGDRCDPVTGEKCNCGNNTESECQATVSKNSNQQCWTLQCSKCKESYSGTPTDGHQCYKQMTLDQKFCINSKLIEECKTKPKPLQPGQAAFFQVQPRYVNVDIRVFIDVLEGSLDMFMSLRDDSLVVTTNASSGQHLLKWDPKYKKRSAWSDGGFKTHSVDLKVPSVKRSYWRGNESFIESTPDGFLGVERDGEGLTTYITINKRNSFLQIRNIRGRLVLTLPKDKFDLITTRFYLGLVASTSGTGIAPTYGILFFRQDQLHIDLFVFFSVFFSCFFLFLAACVIAWKAKQAADLRRARRRHVVEMLHMAKRPFAKIIIQLEKEDPEGSSEVHGPLFLHRKRNKCGGSVGETRPVAVEPTSDGVAAIATFLVRLPGGSEAPVQLCLASSLILISRACHLNSKVFLRRRSSHHGAS